MRATLCFLAICAVLTVGQASSSAHGGKGRGDGYNVPISKNAAWKYYKFDVYNKNIEFTSVRPAPDGSDDPTQPGTIVTMLGDLFNTKGEQIGTNQYVRFVVGDDPVLGSDDARVVRTQTQVTYEFGKAADGFFDDVLHVVVVHKRRTDAAADFADYDAVVTGGRGKFLGATGQMTVIEATYEDGNLVPTSGLVRFEVWVPNNLPR